MDQDQMNQNQMNQPKQSSSATMVLVAILMLLIGGAIGWYVTKTYYPTKETVTVEKTVAPVQTAVSPTPTSTQEASADWKIYKNTKYGFQLTLDDDWKGYQVSEEKEGNVILLRFYIPTTSSKWQNPYKEGYAAPFVISVYTPNEWDKIQSEGGESPLYINKNSQYVFGYLMWQDCPEDLCDKITPQEIKNIISTFKFIK